MIEMKVENILVSTVNDSRVVLLKEAEGERYLPLWVGAAEANAIALKLENVEVPRPLTHDLAKSVIESLGASVEEVLVTELREEIFYGIMVLNRSGQELRIDSRPSDCMAIALRFDAPIYVEEPVLDEAAMVLDPETGELRPASEFTGYKPSEEVPEKPPEAFREVLDEDFEEENQDKE
ncbi:MAG: bifunctional nuclease family protein [Dehalococcoidia bacterium]